MKELQFVQQNLHIIANQLQQLESEQLEALTAIEEVQKTQKAYKFVGNILLSSDKDVLLNELTQKKEHIFSQIESLKKQETSLHQKKEELLKHTQEGE